MLKGINLLLALLCVTISTVRGCTEEKLYTTETNYASFNSGLRKCDSSKNLKATQKCSVGNSKQSGGVGSCFGNYTGVCSQYVGSKIWIPDGSSWHILEAGARAALKNFREAPDFSLGASAGNCRMLAEQNICLNKFYGCANQTSEYQMDDGWDAPATGTVIPVLTCAETCWDFFEKCGPFVDFCASGGYCGNGVGDNDGSSVGTCDTTSYYPLCGLPNDPKYPSRAIFKLVDFFGVRYIDSQGPFPGIFQGQSVPMYPQNGLYLVNINGDDFTFRCRDINAGNPTRNLPTSLSPWGTTGFGLCGTRIAANASDPSGYSCGANCTTPKANEKCAGSFAELSMVVSALMLLFSFKM